MPWGLSASAIGWRASSGNDPVWSVKELLHKIETQRVRHLCHNPPPLRDQFRGSRELIARTARAQALDNDRSHGSSVDRLLALDVGRLCFLTAA